MQENYVSRRECGDFTLKQAMAAFYPFMAISPIIQCYINTPLNHHLIKYGK
jgi:hypothetical protein